MAFKLSKDDIKTRDELTAAVRDKREALEEAIAAYNEKLAELREPVEEAEDDYNGALDDLNGWAQGIGNEASGSFDDKSEKWQESERGEQVREWIYQWETFEGDRSGLEWADELSLDIADAADAVEQLPEDANDEYA